MKKLSFKKWLRRVRVVSVLKYQIDFYEEFGIDRRMLDSWRTGESPEAFVLWIGCKYGLLIGDYIGPR